MIRLLCILLLLANIAHYAWRTVKGDVAQDTDTTEVPTGPPLVLLSEREEALLTATDVDLSGGALGETSCFSLGPFSNQADMRRAFNVMAPYAERSRQRQTVETRDRGYWVYLPAVENREEALQTAQDLAVTGLRDYYVVTVGEQENTISLGLFREEENARRRQSALQTLGFDAQIARRTEETVNYWLDYSRLPESTPPWELVVASNAGVEHRPIPCFRG